MIRAHGTPTVCGDGIIIDHRPYHLSVDLDDLGDLVRGTETVEEVQYRDARGECGGLGDQRGVHHLLYRVGGEHGKTGGPCRHHIAVIAKDRQGLGRQRAGRDMEYRRAQFTGDLVHIRQHQQQPLGGGEGGAERTALQCPVDRPGSSAFALHLDNLRHAAPDIGLALGRPGVGIFTHRRGRCNGVDGNDFIGEMGNTGGGFVAIQADHASTHASSSGLCVFLYIQTGSVLIPGAYKASSKSLIDETL